jgi:beta-galactosidase
MYIGVDYYPEHWPRERWATDARLMREAGFNVVRLAEFAWVNMEPREGCFEFGWLDEALAVLHKQGVRAILSTPTAVMPAWVACAYPECLAQAKDGQRLTWGVRKNNCFTAGTYRMLSQRITEAMGGHFAGAPNVIGWQTDNEFGGPDCFCDTCRVEFQSYLRAKFGTLDEFNRAMGSHFWGHRYGDWAEIQLPDDDASHNPSLLLERKRFNSWLNVRFQHEQVEVLRRTCPRHFVTHNFMGLCPWLDYFDLAKDLDHVSWDNYPVGSSLRVPIGASCGADVMRGLKKKNFWIMEQSAGPSGWGSFSRNPRPGEIRKVAYQQVAHGADGMIWFRWRTCTAGREQYWHGLLGHDGRPLRRYREAAQTAGELHRLEKELAGTTVQADVAIVYDYDSNWAFDFQPCYDCSTTKDPAWWGNNYIQAVRRYYSALFRAGVNADVVRKTDDLSQYRVVIAPHLYVLPDAVADNLVRYVKGGGVLLTDCRTGVKDETGLCHARTLPGKLSAALGITIEEYEAIAPEMDYAVAGGADLEGRFSAVHYADWLTTKGAEALASYEHWHMKGFAAATKHRFGKGWGYYVGTILKEPAFYDALLADVLAAAKVRPLSKPPEGVEISYRQGRGRKLMFVINHTEETRKVAVPAGKTELISGATVGPELELGAYEVAVVKLR